MLYFENASNTIMYASCKTFDTLNNLETIVHSIGEYMACFEIFDFFFYSSDVCLQLNFFALNLNA